MYTRMCTCAVTLLPSSPASLKLASLRNHTYVLKSRLRCCFQILEEQYSDIECRLHYPRAVHYAPGGAQATVTNSILEIMLPRWQCQPHYLHYFTFNNVISHHVTQQSRKDCITQRVLWFQIILRHLVFSEHRVSNHLGREKSPSVVQCIYTLWSQKCP